MNKTKKAQDIRRKALMVAVGLVILLIPLWVIFINVSGSTRSLENIAEKVNPPSEWRQKDRRLEPPRFYCLNDVRCPSLHQSWEKDGATTYENFKAIVKETGLNLSIEGDCTIKQNEGGTIPVCSAKKSIDDLSVNLTLWISKSDKVASQLILNVE